MACLYPTLGVECRCAGNPDTGGNLTCNYGMIPDAATSCPTSPPNAGTGCGATILVCMYPCSGSFYTKKVTAQCVNGIWSWDETSCGGT